MTVLLFAFFNLILDAPRIKSSTREYGYLSKTKFRQKKKANETPILTLRLYLPVLKIKKLKISYLVLGRGRFQYVSS